MHIDCLNQLTCNQLNFPAMKKIYALPPGGHALPKKIILIERTVLVMLSNLSLKI